jgi:hypothetical protein
MPIAETPFEHDDEAEATKCTELPTLELLVGLLTVTPAIAGSTNANRHTNVLIFPTFIDNSPADLLK